MEQLALKAPIASLFQLVGDPGHLLSHAAVLSEKMSHPNFDRLFGPSPFLSAACIHERDDKEKNNRQNQDSLLSHFLLLCFSEYLKRNAFAFPQ
jgi:hypothetical protein